MTTTFTCDLVNNAKLHKWFLEKIHELGVSTATTNTAQSVESLRRYQHLWLPLAAKNANQELVPPPDIAWLSHCHRLAPRNYAEYCKKTFGTLVEATPPFTLQVPGLHQEGSATEATRILWEEAYPNDTFFLSTDDAERAPGDAEALCGFDLLGSTARQATFLWQVSAERFQDEDFLEEGLGNYARFLKLKCRATEEQIILVPTYQIDLIWHTHILSSISNYNKDCKAITGGTLHHDDSLTDRSDGGVLDLSYTATKNLWKTEYGCDYVVVGGMYRGEPPKEFFASEWRSWQQEWRAGGNQHLIGRIGASSTSPPTKWADPDGLTSEGLPAFISTGTSKKLELAGQAKKDNYILGRISGRETGYYHIETVEAHEILFKRVSRRIQTLESDIACGKCCFQGDNPAMKRKEKDLVAMKEVCAVLRERKRAAKPVGRSTITSRDTDTAYYGDNGLWLYPVGLYDCAGGACGGNVACDVGGGCGGSACGAACGGGGGGCGGGGCGGGGCGGGG